jgi:uncharacterized protein YbjT (DUF2867 family)
MKVVLAGAFGKLGADILKELTSRGFEVVAADKVPGEAEGSGGYSTRLIDVTRPETLEGLCDGADAVISTVGLTGASKTVTHYDIDLEGNKNLLSEAKRAGVRKFIYISVLKAETDPSIPMLDAKNKFEAELKRSGIPYMIYRPTGYFYDIARVFLSMVEKGQVNLLGRKDVRANVIDTSDLARYIVEHMEDSGKTVSIGGMETYSYAEIAALFFQAAGKPPVIKRVPAVLFDLLAVTAKLRKTGRYAVIRFSKWTLSRDMVGETCYGRSSFKEYIKNCYRRDDGQ